jgi:flagella basal body P-ring formation protein FlgA
MLGHLFLLAVAACLPVEGDHILIGDLARAIPAFAQVDAAEAVGFSPAPGAQRRFSVGELSRLATRKGVTTDMESVCFERKSKTLTRDAVLAALRESLPEGAQLELIDFIHERVPDGSVEFSRRGLGSAPPREPALWTGRVRYGAARSVSVWAKVRVWISRPALVAIRDLPAGKPIEAGEVRLEYKDANPFIDAAAISSGEIVGRTPRRPIRAGQIVPLSAVDVPAEVTRGEIVGLEARYGAAFLKLEVRAEASGRTGEAIPVRNLDSGKTFRARVLRKGWVAVESTE